MIFKVNFSFRREGVQGYLSATQLQYRGESETILEKLRKKNEKKSPAVLCAMYYDKFIRIIIAKFINIWD